MFGHQPRTAHLKPSCHLLPSVPVSLISVCRINCTQARNLEIILDQNLSPVILAPLAHPTSLSLASHTFRCPIPLGPTLPWVCGGIAQREGTEQCRSLLETPSSLAWHPPPALLPPLCSLQTPSCAQSELPRARIWDPTLSLFWLALQSSISFRNGAQAEPLLGSWPVVLALSLERTISLM